MTELLQALRQAVGEAHVLTEPGDIEAHVIDWRRRYQGRPLAVVRPADTAQVAAVVRACAAAGVAMVPQGGNTGLCGGATPDASGAQVVISLGRMNRIRAIDTDNDTITVEAGCVLASIQQAAEGAGRLFPLSLASEGSCVVGGNLSTNAGGTGVLRYGNTRELTLGLEVVLPSGEVLDLLRGLRKDNTGYDLKHLFIGAEGTLGIITAAVMKLYPAPTAAGTAIVACDTPRQAVELLGLARRHGGARLTAFELFSSICLELVLRHYPDCVAPFLPEQAGAARDPASLARLHPQYVLLEFSDAGEEAPLRELTETVLGEALEAGLIRDAVLASSAAQRSALWALRENISEAQALEGRNIKHDISVPTSAIASFIEQTDALLEQAFPGARRVTFGHLGDGNLHYNLAAPVGMDPLAFEAHLDAVNELVHDSVARFRGSISAEHGIGQLKRHELPRYKSAGELALMKAIKAAIDPRGLMNPGKLLAD
jgi:FAD/FMN-containing dehydrogenase